MNYVPRMIEGKVLRFLDFFPVTAILGPRQCGKSTLAKQIIAERTHSIYLDLELPSNRNKLYDPEAFFNANADKLICLDEIQRAPEIFPIIRSISDTQGKAGQFLILGSASPGLLEQSSETLAGRIGFIDLTPFKLPELKPGSCSSHWLRGGYPDSYLSPDEELSREWRENFIRTYLERDIPSLGFSISTETIRRLWTMLAHVSGQILNKSKFSESLGITQPTVSTYIDILEHTFMVRTLRPYVSNVKKRLVKSPKLYIRDTGLLHSLLGIRSMNELFGHPIYGSSWESYAMEQIITLFPEWRPYFYRTSNGSEIDLILVQGGRKIALEMKAHTAPKPRAGYYHALIDTGISEAYILAPISENEDMYQMGEGLWVSSISALYRKFRKKL